MSNTLKRESDKEEILLRRNIVTIILKAVDPVDEKYLAELGEEYAVRVQREGIEEMLNEYSVGTQFDVDISIKLEEESSDE